MMSTTIVTKTLIKIENPISLFYTVPSTQRKMVYTYTNPTNIFNFIPYDVLQWEINRFLTADDRASMNAVLEPTERIYKKFPADFAIKHSLVAFIRLQRTHVLALTSFTNTSEEVVTNKKSLRKAMKIIKKYIIFLGTDGARLLYKYKANAKVSALHDLNLFLDEDFAFQPYLTEKMRTNIYRTITIVEHTAFVRNVKPSI